MNILLVEDDEVLANGLRSALSADAYHVDYASRGDEALSLIERSRYDAVILDLSLPGVDGSEVLRQMRSVGNNIPVIVISARDTLQERVSGLNLGADDYLTKPFALPELEARLRAVLRRRQTPTQAEVVIGDNLVTIDRGERVVTCGGKPVDLSQREYSLLTILAKRVNDVVTKDDLVAVLSRDGDVLGPNAIEVYIHRLRKKLFHPDLELKTIRGIGYILRCNQ